jgi:hypothetical protein
MTTNRSHDRASEVPVQTPDVGSDEDAEREMRAKARALRALAESALANGAADGTVREYLNAVMDFAGMYVDG